MAFLNVSRVLVGIIIFKVPASVIYLAKLNSNLFIIFISDSILLNINKRLPLFGTVCFFSVLVAVRQVFRILKEIHYLPLPSGHSLYKNGNFLKKKISTKIYFCNENWLKQVQKFFVCCHCCFRAI